LNRHALLVGQFMNAAAENIVLRDDLNNVKAVLLSL
jgi:hypothetical protein